MLHSQVDCNLQVNEKRNKNNEVCRYIQRNTNSLYINYNYTAWCVYGHILRIVRQFLYKVSHSAQFCAFIFFYTTLHKVNNQAHS